MLLIFRFSLLNSLPASHIYNIMLLILNQFVVFLHGLGSELMYLRRWHWFIDILLCSINVYFILLKMQELIFYLFFELNTSSEALMWKHNLKQKKRRVTYREKTKLKAKRWIHNQLWLPAPFGLLGYPLSMLSLYCVLVISFYLILN